MSERIDAAGRVEHVLNDGPVKMGAGASLRAAREGQGLHIGALAVALKVPVKKLEALEADRFDLLPDTVFVRALALSVCRALKVDSAPIMAGLPQLQPPQIKTDEAGLNASFKGSGNSTNTFFAQLANPIGFGVLFLIVAIVAVLFWPAKPTSNSLIPAAEEIKPVNAIASSAPNGVASSQTQLPAAGSPASHEATNVNLLTADTRAFPASGPGASSVLASSVSNGSSDPQLLDLTARGASWVEVTDSKGVSLLRKITTNGEVLHVAGALPLSVVLGRADLVTVLVRGQPFDLAAVSKDNVARFEVK